MFESVSIRSYIKTDFSDIITMANDRLGENYLTFEELHSYINNNNKIGFVATINNEIAGFALAQICNPNETRELVLSEHDWFKKQFPYKNSIGILKTIAVDPKFAKQGIGTALTKHRIEMLKKVPIQYWLLVGSKRKKQQTQRS